MPRYQGRSAKACCYCRSQKIKCSGEWPCTKCLSAKRECLFVSKDRLRSVPEDYIRRLENEISQLRQASRTRPSSEHATVQPHPERLIENTTTEYFVSKLKGACAAPASESPPVHQTAATPAGGIASYPPTSPSISAYTYLPLDYDGADSRVSVKLPPQPYALHLLGQFEAFIGSDYHWFHKQHFSANVEATYNDPRRQAVDRTWLCCFSVVLALGESYSSRTAPSFTLGESSPLNGDGAPPGLDLFKQGLALLKLSYEQPTLEQIEALNLVAFYSYSLNRRRTAYAYAGMALRLAKLMNLPLQTHSATDALELELRKRVWWTTLCMDLMICTELSLTPTDTFHSDTAGLSASSSASAEARDAFSDPEFLTAQVKLYRIKYEIIRKISELRSGDSTEMYSLLNPCLDALRRWRLGFPHSLEYTANDGFSSSTLSCPEMRTIASLLLRYNQCHILLLRPLLLQQLSAIVSSEHDLLDRTGLTSLNAECLRSAQDNSRIQLALSRCDRIAKFGFWESLHIFSSLTIQIIANFMMDREPSSFPIGTQVSLYAKQRILLGEMARAGNLASRDHEKMIEDIEGLFATGQGDVRDAENIVDSAMWSDFFDNENTGFDFLDPFPAGLEGW
ncbi:hypothetical protein BJY04DRAFT_230241 [Aspergillus karnatakaensis]|uniref:uncharacterized protein n=1 Tax=Aspergillus karnatakaensis TaxID=1810916 RepID=UPI003CCE465F